MAKSDTTTFLLIGGAALVLYEMYKKSQTAGPAAAGYAAGNYYGAAGYVQQAYSAGNSIYNALSNV